MTETRLAKAYTTNNLLRATFSIFGSTLVNQPVQIMLKNYLTTAFRNLSRNKSYFFLNLLGLTSGLTVFILITLYVQYEFSFDSYNINKDRIFRVVKEDVDNYYMGTNRFGVTPAPLGPALMDEYPEVEYATRIATVGNRLIGVGEESFLEPSIHGADPEAFRIFTFSAVAGNPENFLNGKNTAVLTQSIATKYFGDRNPIGEIIRYRGEHPFTVTGVIADMPNNSHFRMDIILDYVSVMEIDGRDLNQWGSNSFYTYLLLRKGADPKSMEAKFPALREKYVEAHDKWGPQSTTYHLEALPWIHLNSKVNFDIGTTTDIKRLYISMSIAFLILIIACINYINLATAKALTRWKEVGVRKSIGAQRQNLMGQFLGESFLVALASLLIAILCTHVVLPSFAEFVGQKITLNYAAQPLWIGFYVLLVIFIATGAGFYPAFMLSSVRPVAALKGTVGLGGGRTTLRNLLVVAQFAISGILIICTVIVASQMNYIHSKDMGFVRGQIVLIRLRDAQLVKKLDVFKNELKRIPGVTHVSAASSMPNNITSNNGVKWPGMPDDADLSLYTANVDEDYINLFELRLAAGRSFDLSQGDGARTMMINESAAKALGWDDPIGKEMITWSNDTAKIIGVLKDYNQHSLHLGIEPLQFFFSPGWASQVAVRMEADKRESVMAAIENTYKLFSQEYPFEYTWFDEVVNQQYINDQKTATMANWSTLLTVLIACLGLYGLAMHSTEQRLKEVGIRKILGASVGGLMLLLSRTFLGLVVIAFVIATPAAYWMMSGWLDNFAFHVPIDVSVFVLSLLAMLLIGGLTIGYLTLHAARKNPVEVLKVE